MDDLYFLNCLRSNDWREAVSPRALVEQAIRQSSECGFHYTLVTVGDKREEGWVTAQFGMERSPDFAPLIAVNPLYQHPVAVAKKVASLARFYPNRIGLNLVSGSFMVELKAMRDDADFEARNRRLREFFRVLDDLLSPSGRCDFEGEFYHLRAAQIYPTFPRAKMDVFLSGSTQAPAAAKVLVPHFIQSIRPLSEMAQAAGENQGAALGIIARPSTAEAVATANTLYPPDRKGEMLHALSLANQATPWNVWLMEHLKNHSPREMNFYLSPMQTFRSNAPFIVGSYEEVATRIGHYAELGYRIFLCDFPDGDAAHVNRVFSRLRETRLSQEPIMETASAA